MTWIKINKNILDKNVEYWFDATSILQEMIGSCVETAEVLVVEDSVTEEAMDNLDIACRTARTLINEYNKTGALQFNCMTLRIKFAGGDTVSFKNNEFGSISRAL